jgi:hypothetical protein
VSYTTDRTWVDAEVVTATYFNTYLSTNFEWLHTDKPMCRATDTGGSILVSGSEDSIGANEAIFDNASMVPTDSAEASRITTPASGKYLIGGSYSILTAAEATGVRRVRLRVNETTYVAGQSGEPNDDSAADGSGALISLETLYAFTAADYFEAMGYQKNDSNTTFAVAYAANYTPMTWALWVGV